MPRAVSYFFHTESLANEIDERIRSRVLDPAHIELLDGAYARTSEIGVSSVNGSRYPSCDLIPCSECGELHHRNAIDGSLVYPNRRNFCGSECARHGGIVCLPNGSNDLTIDLHDCDHQLMSYAASPQRMDSTTERDPFLFGVEVEKEDYEARQNALREAIEREWIAVSDGSLGSDGFELVSPAYNLTASDSEWRRCFRTWDLLGAESTTSCGGHITISKRGLSGPQLARSLGDGIPLLFAMFPWRLRSQWSAPRNAAQMEEGDKYRAVNVKRHTVEMRIFSRVQNGSQLEARVDLLSHFLRRAECVGFEDELSDRDSSLWSAVDSCYAGFECDDERNEKRDRAIERFSLFRKWYYGRYAASDLAEEGGELYPIRKFIRRNW